MRISDVRDGQEMLVVEEASRSGPDTSTRTSYEMSGRAPRTSARDRQTGRDGVAAHARRCHARDVHLWIPSDTLGLGCVFRLAGPFVCTGRHSMLSTARQVARLAFGVVCCCLYSYFSILGIGMHLSSGSPGPPDGINHARTRQDSILGSMHDHRCAHRIGSVFEAAGAMALGEGCDSGRSDMSQVRVLSAWDARPPLFGMRI